MDKIETIDSGRERIISEIETYISEGGGEYEDWYVGLTDDPFEPINGALSLHKVQSQMLTYIEAASSQIAQAVAEHFVSLCGTDGNVRTNESNRASRALYVYKKVAHFIC